MTQGPDYLYFFHNEAMEFFYCDSRLNVFTTTQPRPLNYTLDGWQEISIHVERNLENWGLEKSFTIPLGAVEDGAAIIKEIFYSRGHEGKLFLLILEQKLSIANGKYRYFYDYLYRGEADLSTFDHEGPKVTCNYIEGGLSALIKANDTTVVEIDIDAPGYVNVSMDGLALKAASNFITIDSNDAVFSPQAYSHLWLTIGYIGNDGTVFNTAAQSTQALKFFKSSVDYDDNRFADNFFFHAIANVTVNFKATFDVTMYNADYTELYLKNSNGTRYVLFNFDGPAQPGGSTLNSVFEVDKNITLAAGEKLYLINKLKRNLQLPSSSVFIKSSSLAVSYDSRYQTTYIKTRFLDDVYAQIIGKITGGKYTGRSLFLQNKRDVVLTSFDAIRGIAGSKLKTSLAQFRNSLNVRFNIGEGIVNETMYIELKDFWLEGNVVDIPEYIDLPGIAKLSIRPATELLFTSLEIGYAEQTYDMLNGKGEPNTKHTYTVPAVRGVKKLTLISDYRADAYGIENARINLQGKQTTDNGSDNDVAFLHITTTPSAYLTVDSSPIFNLDRTLNAGATGLIDAPSMFNIYFSPKRCLLAWGWYFRSVLNKLDDKYLKFKSSDKTADMVADGVVEKADVQIGELPAGKFHPVVFEIETRVPANYQDLLKVSPIRQYRFKVKNVTLTGAALSSGIEPGSNKTQVFKLLSLAGNDLYKLKKINE